MRGVVPRFLGTDGAISEFTGGALIILGLRYAAALIVVFVIIATAIAHRYWEFASPSCVLHSEMQLGQNARP
jgi:uncharacterized membrane protein YphA (DoxX/SURF4 family)